MINLYDYLDYRKFLQDFYDAEKKRNSFFSYRYFAIKLKIDSSNLYKILDGKRHPSATVIQKFITFFNFSKKEGEYFKTLVRFARAKSEKEGQQLFEKLLEFKNVKQIQVQANQYEFYQKWYHTAIFSLLYYYDFKGDFKKLADQLTPAITPKQARESVELLEKLGFIAVDRDGKYVHTRKAVTTGESWRSIAIRQYQEDTIKLALHSLNNEPKESRDISTLSVTVTKDTLEEIREITRQYRKSIVNLVDEVEKPDNIYQINVQIFPLTDHK
jgi:uncharacterized protein (TIGR02147 family)